MVESLGEFTLQLQAFSRVSSLWRAVPLSLCRSARPSRGCRGPGRQDRSPGCEGARLGLLLFWEDPICPARPNGRPVGYNSGGGELAKKCFFFFSLLFYLLSFLPFHFQPFCWHCNLFFHFLVSSLSTNLPFKMSLNYICLSVFSVSI